MAALDAALCTDPSLCNVRWATGLSRPVPTWKANKRAPPCMVQRSRTSDPSGTSEANDQVVAPSLRGKPPVFTSCWPRPAIQFSSM